MITTDYETRRIAAKIDDGKLTLIKAFVQGAVYCHCNISARGTKFAARDLFGGDNYYWEGTPLFALYKWHKVNNASDPVTMAGKDIGWVLLDVLAEDKRHFSKSKEYTNVYEWLPADGEEYVE
ncbi:MAG: hypothetical protein WBI82_13905 [Sphaerochaeta sp.]